MQNKGQSKLESKLEVGANYLTGFILAYLIYDYVVLPIQWLQESAFAVTTLYTVTSIIRSYFWRRYFNSKQGKI